MSFRGKSQGTLTVDNLNAFGTDIRLLTNIGGKNGLVKKVGDVKRFAIGVQSLLDPADAPNGVSTPCFFARTELSINLGDVDQAGWKEQTGSSLTPGEKQRYVNRSWLTIPELEDPIFELGYCSTGAEATVALNNGEISMESMKAVYPDKNFNAKYLNLAAAPIDYRVLLPVLVLNNSNDVESRAVVAVSGAFIDKLQEAIGKYGEGDEALDPHLLVFEVTRPQTDYEVSIVVQKQGKGVFAPVYASENFGKYARMSHDEMWEIIETIGATANGGDFEPQAVRDYLVAITRFETWEEMVEAYRINRLSSIDDLIDSDASLDTEDIPF